MNVLTRGDLLQRMRLTSGLVLFAFAGTHFLNHALGLVSLDAMHGMQAWRKVVTRSWLGSGALLIAFAVHISLGLYRISRRLTWRLPPWEAFQIATGVAIPLLLITHVVYNRGAASLAGTDDTYAYELANLWPAFAWQQSLLLLLVWVHGSIGIHYWLSLAPWYRQARPVLFGLAVALPVAALAGFSVAGRQMAAAVGHSAVWHQLQVSSRAPDPAVLARLDALHDALMVGFLALLVTALLVPMVRLIRQASGSKVEVSYRGGPVVRTAVGPTLLEISRMNLVPHASVCGGRARCSTCRVGVESGLADLPPPTSAEAMTLASIKAPPHVRLACQVRPREPVVITRLVSPPAAARGRAQAQADTQGVERNLIVLFLDTRGFTRISEKRLPYDVVFILNRLFAEVGEAIHRHGGTIDKYLGDGLMALFGVGDGEEAGCRNVLRAASDIDIALDRLNREILSETGAPLRVGMGVDVGPLVVGHIGHAQSASVTVIGNTVNAASRMEALTKECDCQLIVATEVLEQAGLALESFRCEEVDIRGLSAPRRVALVRRARDLPKIGAPAPPAAAVSGVAP